MESKDPVGDGKGFLEKNPASAQSLPCWPLVCKGRMTGLLAREKKLYKEYMARCGALPATGRS